MVKAVVCPSSSLAQVESAAVTGRVVVLGKMVGIALWGLARKLESSGKEQL